MGKTENCEKCGQPNAKPVLTDFDITCERFSVKALCYGCFSKIMDFQPHEVMTVEEWARKYALKNKSAAETEVYIGLEFLREIADALEDGCCIFENEYSGIHNDRIAEMNSIIKRLRNIVPKAESEDQGET